MFILSLELVLILTYFLIQLWGSKLYKIRSSFYLALFTLIGSFILLAAANNRIYITGPELYKVSARNRSYIKPDLRPIDWARAAVELLIPARCSSPFRASDSVKLFSSGQIFGSTHAS